MPATYSLSSGRVLQFEPGLPGYYTGTALIGSSPRYCREDFGDIIIQEVQNANFIFRLVTIHCKKPGVIVCRDHYHHPVVFARMALHTPVYEITKGTGKCELPSYHFAMFAGMDWTTLINIKDPGETVFMEVAWSSEWVMPYLQDQIPLAKALREIIPRVANRIAGPIFEFNEAMRDYLKESDLEGIFSGHYITNRMKEVFEIMLREMTFNYRVKSNISEQDWKIIISIEGLIEENLDTQYPISHLARVAGMSETKLKGLYPKVTGTTIEESRKYKLLIKLRNEALLKKTPLKVLYKQSGYASVPSLNDACKRLIACCPGELTREKWNTDME